MAQQKFLGNFGSFWGDATFSTGQRGEGIEIGGGGGGDGGGGGGAWARKTVETIFVGDARH